MPRIPVKKTYFDQLLGKSLTVEELIDLGFDFGIEIEEDENDKTKVIFEIAANRHDLSSAETLAETIGIYLGLRNPPVYKHVAPSGENNECKVTKATQQIRPVFVSAILRNITFDQDRYDSFIDLQDKLHQNLARRRTLVSIGTHDLDTIKGPFTYDALPPREINFTPLNQKESMSGEQLIQFYETDSKIKEYIHIIKDSPVFPVLYDVNRTVMSLPPLINSDHSKIKLTTKNVFIDVTATDNTKAQVLLSIIVAAFSRFCSEPFTFEQVNINYEHSGETVTTPSIEKREIEAEVDYINKLIGINVDTNETINLLKKMGLHGKQAGDKKISVEVPILRSDILHACDIAEDVGIAYGINNIPIAHPSASTTGSQLTINKISDLVRLEVAQAGYSECLNFALCSILEVTDHISRKGLEQAVQIANPKTKEFQVGRTTLLPGLLKSLASNRAQKLPLNLFEVGDIILKADNEVGSKNERRLACCHSNENTSGFELIHGFLDYIMLKLNISSDSKKAVHYRIKESQQETFFPGMQAEIFLNDTSVGIFGILHPKVLNNFNWTYPTSYLELNLEKIINEGYLKQNTERK